MIQMLHVILVGVCKQECSDVVTCCALFLAHFLLANTQVLCWWKFLARTIMNNTFAEQRWKKDT